MAIQLNEFAAATPDVLAVYAVNPVVVILDTFINPYVVVLLIVAVTVGGLIKGIVNVTATLPPAGVVPVPYN